MIALARPRKDGLDYFPLDVDLFEDDKIKILKARYGADGITYLPPLYSSTVMSSPSMAE